MAGRSQRPGAGRSGSPGRRASPARPRASAPAPRAAARPSSRPAPPPDDRAGDRWLVASWASVVIFLLVAVPAAAGVSALDDAAVGVPLALFLLGVVLMLWAYFAGLARTTRGDNVVVSNLYFLAGSAPRRVQVHLFGALTASIAAAAAIAAWNPAGVLIPILPLAINGMWAVRHGTFPPRPGRDGNARDRQRVSSTSSSGRRRGGRPGQ